MFNYLFIRFNDSFDSWHRSSRWCSRTRRPFRFLTNSPRTSRAAPLRIWGIRRDKPIRIFHDKLREIGDRLGTLKFLWRRFTRNGFFWGGAFKKSVRCFSSRQITTLCRTSWRITLFVYWEFQVGFWLFSKFKRSR